MTLDRLTRFLDQHTAWIGGVAGLSVVMLIGSVLLAPWLLARLPEDYFHNPHHRPMESLADRPLLRWSLIIGKNLLGVLLFLAGVSMLVLPGQGILTIVMSLVLLDFPGKFAIKHAFIQRPKIAAWINRRREHHHQPPFRPRTGP